MTHIATAPKFLGYIARTIAPVDAAFKAAETRPGARDHLVEACSVTDCFSESYRNLDRWDFNGDSHYDTVAEALTAVPAEKLADVRVFAHWLLPVLFEEGVRHPLPSGDAAGPLEPEPGSVRLIGFDPAVVRPRFQNWYCGFECSPLVCNGLCDEHPVNAHCLVDSLDDALRLAEEFSRDEPEPGVYGVIRVGEVLHPA